MSVKVYAIQDIPRPSDMAGYLGQVRSVREALPVIPGLPELPPDMNHLTYQGANNIELTLLEADRLLNNMENSWIYSGEADTGGD